VHAERHLRELVGEGEVGRRVVHGVAPEDDKGLDLAGGHCVGQRLEVGDGVELVRIRDRRVEQRRARRP